MVVFSKCLTGMERDHHRESIIPKAHAQASYH